MSANTRLDLHISHTIIITPKLVKHVYVCGFFFFNSDLLTNMSLNLVAL